MTDEPANLSPKANSADAWTHGAAALVALRDLMSESLRAQSGLDGQKKRLKEIASALTAGQLVPAVTVRVFLDWFWHAQRRGRFITAEIRERLEEAKLITVPDFEATYLDAEIKFELAPPKAPVVADSVPALAEVIVIAENGDILVAPPASVDPTYRISKLAAANRIPLSVKPDTTLKEAVTLMIAQDYSQVPVMTNERDVKGMTSWNAIGTRLALGQSPQVVREAMDPHAEVPSDASLFTAIPIIVDHGYALVRSSVNKGIVGIITTSDLSLQFQQLSEPFLLLGEIENHIRRIIDGKFGKEELRAAKDESDSERAVESASDLTFGEYKRMLENPNNWAALKLNLDRGAFIERLEIVRLIRNDVMHFDPDGIGEADLRSLREFTRFLRTLQTIGAT